MYQAYAGKILDGKPAILEDVTLPENTRLVIMVLDELPAKFKAPLGQGTGNTKKAKAIDSLKGIIPADFPINLDELRRERIEKRGLVQ